MTDSHQPVKRIDFASGSGPAASGFVLGEPVFAWRDHSKYVEVAPVRTGWLVVWGRYEEMGKRRLTLGNRVYRDVAGVRRRVVDAVMELTHNRQEALDALGLLTAKGLPEYVPVALPDPL